MTNTKPHPSNSIPTDPGDQGSSRWSIGMSLILHVSLLLILFFMFRPSDVAGRGEELRQASVVLVKQDSNQETEYLEETDVPESNSPAAESQPVATLADSAPPELKLPELEDVLGPITAADTPTVSANQLAVPTKRNHSSEFELTEEDLEMIRREQRLVQSRKPVGQPATLNVFGSGDMTGRTFVFVLDRSQSMGTGGLGVLSRARKELKIAVSQLADHHSFQVVGYNDRTITISRRALLNANHANKQLVPEFIGNMVAFGPTKHEQGLIGALAFRPDAIVLMTDGGAPGLNETVLKRIRLMARGKTQIHCVQFGIGPNQNKDNFMLKLAEQNNGSFNYINVNNWSK